jgi:hypothetical protein
MTFAKLSLAFVTIAGTTLTSALAQDLSFRDFPYLVYCEMEGVDRAFYFSRLGADGVAIYLTPDNQAGTITIDGVARRVGGGEQTGSCADRTIDELRSSGQTYDLPK